ncbi:MAG: DUF484 family protein [Deltaproteobacteria bacterium]
MGKEEDIQRINEEIGLRFSRIGAGVNAAETIAGLFESLLAGIEKEFEVPFVWLALTDDEKAAPVAARVQSSKILRNRLGVVSQELLEKLLPQGHKPLLSNQDLQPFYRLMPPARKYFARSLAVVPMALDGQIIGVWINGDADPERYSADMDVTLLAQLALTVSRRLTELAAVKSDASANEQPGGLHG